MREELKSMKRSSAMRRALVWAAQIGVFALSGVVAFLLRFDLSLPPAYRIYLAYALPIWILVKIAVFHVAKLDRGLWRYLFSDSLQQPYCVGSELHSNHSDCAAGIPAINLHT